LKIGAYTILPIETGSFWLDGGSIFGVVPKVVWKKSIQVDDRNRVKLAARCLLIKGNGRIILVDSGNGAKKTDKFRELYSLDTNESDLIISLGKCGVKPADVTDVILTHLHFDHSGGATMRDGDTVVPAFPKARYYVQNKQWLQALNPTPKDRASYISTDYQPLKDHGVLELLDGDCELFPGIHILLTDGHTPALQMLKICDDEKTLFFPGDMIPFAFHVSLPCITAFDLMPLVTLDDKSKYLAKAVDEDWLLFFEHDPMTVAGKVQKTEKGFSFGRSVSFE
jgi:glyoxylase-like metal-dependent hydrolase (beta-lactamase superfamily II)